MVASVIEGHEDCFRSLLRSDKCSAEEILQYKEEHIAKNLEYAYQHCPYYKARFKEFGLTEKDFKQLDYLDYKNLI